MKPITTNIWSFPQLVADGCVYVDKTDLLYKLISSTDRSVFISRPRRFGKSLMLSTLKAIFEGRKELFEGLKISQTDYDWKTYPVLMLDMSSAKSISYEGMKEGLNRLVMGLARDLSLEIEESDDPSQTFLSLWNEILTHKLQVVVLVDEYDVPLQGFLNRQDEYEKVRQLLHDFYIRFKSHAESIRFLMLTGVTKIAKLSIFSGLNTPTDLTFRQEYATLLGYTHDELKTFFADHIAAFAAEKNETEADIFNKLLEWYDHYRFSAQSEACVLNPVSLGYALTTHAFKNYWIETGQSAMIIEQLLRNNEIPSDLENLLADESDLNSYDLDGVMSTEALFYQGGYLTIKNVRPSGILELGAPNREVKEFLVRGYLQKKIAKSEIAVRDNQIMAGIALREGRLNDAIALFRAAVAACPYSWLIGNEGGAKILFLSFFYSIPHTYLSNEKQMASGIIDAVYEGDKEVYIFEFKFGKSPQEAFDQIIEKGYARAYLIPHPSSLIPSKKVYGIGLNFNPNENVRGIDEPVIKEITEL